MAEASHIRVSDHEREQVAAALREHYAAGRLDSGELEERVQRAYSARTIGELDALSADLPALPALPATRSEPDAALIQRRAELRQRALQSAGGSLAPFLICTLIWAATGSGFFWPVFLLIAPVALVARVGWALYGPAPDLEAAEAEIRGHRDRRDRRERRHRHRR